MAKKKQDAAWSARMLPSGSPFEARGDEAWKVDPLNEQSNVHPIVDPDSETADLPLSGEYKNKEYYAWPHQLSTGEIAYKPLKTCMLCGKADPPVVKASQAKGLDGYTLGLYTISEARDLVGPMSSGKRHHLLMGTHPECDKLYFGASNGLGAAGADYIARNTNLNPEEARVTLPKDPEDWMEISDALSKDKKRIIDPKDLIN